ncbi:hypothetical protein MSG28_006149 [Choristoneura fumiferana]|uniref:Uncharacterized protein n=1 Tax=Choristoneura fumiferana TaxID=7141 RepID=A0ACC0JDT5_CHOFU|nr:hypothetical protein MSG28_006149 [Choristoneura fumiferana]
MVNPIQVINKTKGFKKRSSKSGLSWQNQDRWQLWEHSTRISLRKCHSSNSSEKAEKMILSLSNGTSPYSTVNQFSEIADGWTTVRSSSCSEADPLAAERPEPEDCVLDDATGHQYHCFKRVYADILHRWQLLYKRTEVMKLVVNKQSSAHVGPELGALCAYCGRATRAAACAPCRRLALRCAVFEKHDTCPTGCGCKCLIDSNAFWKGVKYA